jgi:hypothetical protein
MLSRGGRRLDSGKARLKERRLVGMHEGNIGEYVIERKRERRTGHNGGVLRVFMEIPK